MPTAAPGNMTSASPDIAIPGASEERWPCPVIFGPEDQYLVGATTLEAFSLMVDPESALLVPRRHSARPL